MPRNVGIQFSRAEEESEGLSIYGIRLTVYFYRVGRNCEWPFAENFALPFYVGDTERLQDRFLVETDDPRQADFFLFPYDLGPAIDMVGLVNVVPLLRRLPWLERYEERHVFFLGHDESRPFGFRSIFFRNGAGIRSCDPLTFAMPYPSEDFSGMLGADFTTLPYDTSFVGFRGHTSLRSRMAESVRRCNDVKSFIRVREVFYHCLSPADKERGRREFLESLELSRTVLCPRGEGCGSVRFFEALSAGRVPVLLADDYSLPFADKISYADFIFRIPESLADQAGPLLAWWFSRLEPRTLQEMAGRARQAWERYLRPEIWLQRVCEVLAELREGELTCPQPEAAAFLPDFLGKMRGEGLYSKLFSEAARRLYAKAAELPERSCIVCLEPAEELVPLLLAGALASNSNESTRVCLVGSFLPSRLTAVAENRNLASWLRFIPSSDLVPGEEFPARSIDLLIVDGELEDEERERLLFRWLPRLRYGGSLFVCLPPSWGGFSRWFAEELRRKRMVCSRLRGKRLGMVEIQGEMAAALRRALQVDAALLRKIPAEISFHCE